MFEIKERIDQTMPNFYNLFVSESPYRVCSSGQVSLWVLVHEVRSILRVSGQFLKQGRQGHQVQ